MSTALSASLLFAAAALALAAFLLLINLKRSSDCFFAVAALAALSAASYLALAFLAASSFLALRAASAASILAFFAFCSSALCLAILSYKAFF